MDIVEELRSNRESGARRLEAEYKVGLMALARRFCKDPGDAEELVNSTFAEVINNIDDYIEQSAFFAWMCQILTSKFARSVRRKSNRMEVYPGDVPEVVDELGQEAIYANLDASLLRDAIQALPKEMRDVVVMHFLMEQPVASVAKFLALPVSTVKWRLHIARKELARRLGANAAEAVRKPGGKALLLALALCGVAALGAGARLAVVRLLLPPTPPISTAIDCNRQQSNHRQMMAGTPLALRQPTLNLQTLKPSNSDEGETMKSTTLLSATIGAALASGAMRADASATSALYAGSDHLLAHWDAIDNAGTGSHDASATVWKNLTGDLNYDLAIVEGRGSWSPAGNSLVVNGVGAVVERVSPAYRTIEVVYKLTDRASRVLFTSGDTKRILAFNNYGIASGKVLAYFNGESGNSFASSQPAVQIPAYEPCTLAATYDGYGYVSCTWFDGVARVDSTGGSDWGQSGSGANRRNDVIQVGGLSQLAAYDAYASRGEVYAIRLYDTVLTPEQLARNRDVDRARFMTASAYVQDGLVSLWDGRENAGPEVHDPSASSWKNLVAGGMDLTLGGGTFSGNALQCNGSTMSAYGAATMDYKSLEILFRNTRTGVNGYLFGNGAGKYCVLASGRVQWVNGRGTTSFNRDVTSTALLSWANDHAAYLNATALSYGDYNDTWGPGGAYVQVGGRSDNNAATTYEGDIHCIRAYSSELTPAQIAANYKVDSERLAHPMTWQGPGATASDGDFGAAGNWLYGGTSSASVPGDCDTAAFSYGRYMVSLDADRTVWGVKALNGNVFRAGSVIDATLDMGGNSLAIRRQLEVTGDNGWNGYRYPAVAVSNGTASAATVLVGQADNRTLGSGTLSIGAGGTVRADSDYVKMNGPFSRIAISDSGVLSCRGFVARSTKARLDSYAPGEYDRAEIAFSGNAPSLAIRDWALVLDGSIDLKFDIPVNGFATAPIAVASGVSVAESSADPVRIVIDASAFDPGKVGKSTTLLSCSSASTASLQRLADNIVFENTPERRQGAVTVEGGNALVYTAPCADPFVLVVR